MCCVIAEPIFFAQGRLWSPPLLLMLAKCPNLRALSCFSFSDSALDAVIEPLLLQIARDCRKLDTLTLATQMCPRLSQNVAAKILQAGALLSSLVLPGA